MKFKIKVIKTVEEEVDLPIYIKSVGEDCDDMDAYSKIINPNKSITITKYADGSFSIIADNNNKDWIIARAHSNVSDLVLISETEYNLVHSKLQALLDEAKPEVVPTCNYTGKPLSECEQERCRRLGRCPYAGPQP